MSERNADNPMNCCTGESAAGRPTKAKTKLAWNLQEPSQSTAQFETKRRQNIRTVGKVFACK